MGQRDIRDKGTHRQSSGAAALFEYFVVSPHAEMKKANIQNGKG
jgi:hypothetical protein